MALGSKINFSSWKPLDHVKWEGEKANGGSLENIDIKCISEGAEERCQAARRRTKTKQTKNDTIEDGEWNVARKE